MTAVTLLISALLVASLTPATSMHFDPGPWLQDLDRIKTTFQSKYANWDWAVFERQADVPALFAKADKSIQVSESDAEAKAAIDRMMRQLGDGHVLVEWPHGGQGGSPLESPTPQAATCTLLGYDRDQAGSSVAATIDGYRALPNASAPEFPAGVIQLAGRRVGIVRIGEFAPTDSPELCEIVLQIIGISSSAPCDAGCSDRVEAEAYKLMSSHLAERLHELRAAGAEVLVIDIMNNGGGSEWAEAAARIVTVKPLLSERLGFVRDAHWTEKWRQLAFELRKAAPMETGQDRQKLVAWAGEAEKASMQAATPCSSKPFLDGKRPDCSWLGTAGFATGLVRDAPLRDFKNKSWGSLVFTPAEYSYERGAWRGPVIVLVNGETWSAAEEFASELQDSGIATVVGSPSGGAGCGHTGDDVTVLPNSHGVLKLPDCARFRADGRDEVAGVDPDILVGWRQHDGPQRQKLRLQDALTRLLKTISDKP